MNCHENAMPYYQFKPKETSNFKFENWIVTHEEVVLHRVMYPFDSKNSFD